MPTTSEIMKQLGISRQRVYQLARHLGWVREPGIEKCNSIMWKDADVEQYVLIKKRTQLLRNIDYKEYPHRKKIVTTSEFDTVCGLCGKFAVEYNGKRLCEDGHLGRTRRQS